MTEKFDIIIIGSGIAGLSATIEASKNKKISIALIDQGNEKFSNSYHAQGGIACAIGKKDSWKEHAKDTIKAGEGLCDEKIVNLITKLGPDCIKEIMDYGFEFDGENKNPELGLEGGHSKRRILHKNGDQTGKEITEFLRKIAKEQTNVYILDQCFVNEIQTDKNSYVGIKTIEEQFTSNALIMATGGYAACFEKTTNPKTTIGSCIGIAYSAGCDISGMEFVQFHPTTIQSLGANFLITEAVRGEGGKIVNGKGEQIVNPLFTRDKVSRAIYYEMIKGEKLYLDARNMQTDFQKRFPTVYKELIKNKINPEKELIPIETAAHYTIGGIKINEKGMTNIKGIYGAGECTCSGFHGANRLASNSLLEGIVMGKIAAQNAIKQKKATEPTKTEKQEKTKEGISHEVAFSSMKKIMWNCCGVVRTQQNLKDGLAGIIALETKMEKNETNKCIAIQNALKVCKLTIEAAIKRKESIGTHYREN